MVGNVWLYAVLLACTDGFEPRGPSAPAPADDAPPFPTSRTPADWPFSAASPWNFPVGSGLTLEDPDAPCTRAVRDPSVDAWVNAETWSHPLARAASTDTVVDIWEDGAFATRIAVPPGAQPSLPAWPDGDAHLHVIDAARRRASKGCVRTSTPSVRAYVAARTISRPRLGAPDRGSNRWPLTSSTRRAEPHDP